MNVVECFLEICKEPPRMEVIREKRAVIVINSANDRRLVMDAFRCVLSHKLINTV